MSRMQKGPIVDGTWTMAMTLVLAGSLATQDQPLPASPTPPPDVVERQRIPQPPATAMLPVHPASAQEPPEVQERKQVPQPPTAPTLPMHATTTQPERS